MRLNVFKKTVAGCTAAGAAIGGIVGAVIGAPATVAAIGAVIGGSASSAAFASVLGMKGLLDEDEKPEEKKIITP